MRHDLEGFIVAYVYAAGIAAEAEDRALFRAGDGTAKRLRDRPVDSVAICELVKRRLQHAG